MKLICTHCNTSRRYLPEQLHIFVDGSCGPRVEVNCPHCRQLISVVVRADFATGLMRRGALPVRGLTPAECDVFARCSVEYVNERIIEEILS